MPLQPAPPDRIDTTSFVLRPWSVADENILRAALDASDTHLRTWTPWVVDGKVPGLTLRERLAQHAHAFETGKEWVYGMFSPDGREVLGGAGLYPRVGPDSIEIGYWLSVHHTGRGLATAAAAELMRVAFEAPGIEVIEIHCATENTASNRVPRRLGYRIRQTVDDESAGRAPERLNVWKLTREEFNAS